MSLAQPLSALRQDLRKTSIEDLPTALVTLDELLPDGSKEKAVVTALRTALNQLNKDNFRGLIDSGEYARRIAQISAKFIDFLDTLTEADFEPPAAAVKSGPPEPKRGSVLYKIPRQMPLRKASLCTVRVAVDEEAIFDDLVLDDGVRLRKRVEVSDMMTAELLDIEGNVFQVAAFNDVRQRVRDTGYTQWLFRVTPLVEGEHQLMVKVSLMEFDPNTREYVPRNVSILETVTIVTEAPAPSDSDDTPLRSSGHQFALGPAEMPNPEPLQTSNSRTSNSNRPLRAAALFLAFIMLSSSAAWAFTPPATRDWWVAAVRDTAEGYAAYIEKHRDTGPANPRLETAYFRKAEKTDSLPDLRLYTEQYPQGEYVPQVVEKIEQHEVRTIASIRQQPDAAKVRRFLVDYPDARHLPEVKQAVEELPAEQRTALLPAIETGYVRTMQAQPSAQKFEQYRRDYPRTSRLTEMAQAAATSPAVLQAVQPALDEVIVEKTQAASSPAEVEAVLPALQAAGSSRVAERVEQILEQKPAPLRKRVAAQVQQVRVKVAERERQKAPPSPSVGGETGLSAEGPKAEGGVALPADKQPTPATNTPTPGTQEKPVLNADSPAPGTQEKSKSEAISPPNGGAGGASTRKSGLTMIPVAGGTFLMGSPKSEKGFFKDECQHSVTVANFSIGKYEVTQADWREVMGKDPSDNQGCDDCPVEQVSWNYIQDFLKALNIREKASGKKYRLPTEAEWEYAARGGAKNASIATGGGFRYAGSNDLGKVAWHQGNSGSKTHPVGGKAPNQLGLYDMSGNVFEWCQDKYGPYPNCTGSEGDYRVRRGGGWDDHAGDCRVSTRTGNTPTHRDNDIGFRLSLQ